MPNLPPQKILPIAFYALLIAGLGLIGYIGLARRASMPSSTETNEQVAQSAPVISLAICAESNEKLCVLSTGYDAEGNLLISLKAALQPIPTVYGILRSQKIEIRFDCHVVDIAPRLLYCLGPFSGDVAAVEFELYATESDALLASGFLVPGETVRLRRPSPVPIGGVLGPTQTPVSYPGTTPPSYPSYPSYP
ncbi:MAG: hypothetical protein Fur0016_04630 [Anaerolineales bacterium]